MAHIKWVGIIKGEIADYQKGYLDSKAKPMELPATLKEMMTKALPFALAPFAIIFLSIFIKTSLAGETVIEPIFLLAGLWQALLDCLPTNGCTLLYIL